MPTLEKADANPEDVPHFAYQQFMPLCIEKQKGLSRASAGQIQIL